MGNIDNREKCKECANFDTKEFDCRYSKPLKERTNKEGETMNPARMKVDSTKCIYFKQKELQNV